MRESFGASPAIPGAGETTCADIAGGVRGGTLPGVNFYGPVGVLSGLGTAARGYLAALRSAGVPVCVVPVHELFTHQASVGRVERRQRPRHPVSIVSINADSMHRFRHFHGAGFARAQYRIGIWMWELPALRDEWWEELRHFDEIWVASSFCRRAVQSMTAKPVVRIPVPTICNAALRPRDRLSRAGREAFTFLYAFDASSQVERKNPRCLLDAFRASFGAAERVRLVLKVLNAACDPDLCRYLDAVADSDPRCVILRRPMQAEEIEALLEAADCYVSPHRSEGFGLTVAEAMAAGLPVIATDYGGTTDFLTPEVGFPLRYRLVEVAAAQGPYGSGAIWAEPSREHLGELLRAVVDDPGMAAARGEQARERIRERYSASAVGRRAAERLRRIAGDMRPFAGGAPP